MNPPKAPSRLAPAQSQSHSHSQSRSHSQSHSRSRQAAPSGLPSSSQSHHSSCQSAAKGLPSASAQPHAPKSRTSKTPIPIRPERSVSFSANNCVSTPSSSSAAVHDPPATPTINSPDLILSLLKEIQLEVASVKQCIVALELSDQRMSRIESYLFSSKVPTSSAFLPVEPPVIPVLPPSSQHMAMDLPNPVIPQGWDDLPRSSSISPLSISSS